MAKANVKTVEKAVNLPAGEKIARDGGEVTPLDAASIRLVMQGWEIKKKIEELDAQLKTINAQLMEAHGAGASLIVHGVCRASITERELVRISNAERLKAVLGFRFTDLVKTEIAYKPEQRLIEMAVDGDEPLAPSIRECLTVGKSESVTWRAEK